MTLKMVMEGSSGVAKLTPEWMPIRRAALRIRPADSTVTGRNSNWPPLLLESAWSYREGHRGLILQDNIGDLVAEEGDVNGDAVFKLNMKTAAHSDVAFNAQQ